MANLCEKCKHAKTRKYRRRIYLKATHDTEISVQTVCGVCNWGEVDGIIVECSEFERGEPCPKKK